MQEINVSFRFISHGSKSSSSLRFCWSNFNWCYLLSADKKLKPLSVDEERFMRAFYEAKVQEVCSAFEFPHKIQVHCSPSRWNFMMKSKKKFPILYVSSLNSCFLLLIICRQQLSSTLKGFICNGLLCNIIQKK